MGPESFVDIVDGIFRAAFSNVTQEVRPVVYFPRVIGRLLIFLLFRRTIEYKWEGILRI